MPLYNKLPENLTEVDVIIAGGSLYYSLHYRCILSNSLQTGGTAACIVAGRLAAANPRLEILVIE